MVDTDDLVELTLSDDRSSAREVELAQRLQIAMDMIEERRVEDSHTSDGTSSGGLYS